MLSFYNLGDAIQFALKYQEIIPKKNINPILITNHLNLKKVSKISKSFNIFKEEKFIKYHKTSILKNSETSYELLNLNKYMR